MRRDRGVIVCMPYSEPGRGEERVLAAKRTDMHTEQNPTNDFALNVWYICRLPLYTYQDVWGIRRISS